MYLEHFGLQRVPFAITPEVDFFYEGGNRGVILERLQSAIENGEGLIKVVGEVGSGKTLICRTLMERLPEKVETLYLFYPNLGPEHILPAVLSELGAIPPGGGHDRYQLLHRLQSCLIERHAEGRQVVLFVEEAQGMPLATLEEVRLLCNLETERRKLLQVVLFGQPELDQLLAGPESRQIRERITSRFYIHALSGHELDHYLQTRLRGCGYRGPHLFSQAAIRAIRWHSGGSLRRINILAHKAMMAAFAASRRQVGYGEVVMALRSCDFSPRWFQAWRRPVLIAAGLLVMVPVTTALLSAPIRLAADPVAESVAEANVVREGGLTGAGGKSRSQPPVFRGKLPPRPEVAPVGAPALPEMSAIDAAEEGVRRRLEAARPSLPELSPPAAALPAAGRVGAEGGGEFPGAGAAQAVQLARLADALREAGTGSSRKQGTNGTSGPAIESSWVSPGERTVTALPVVTASLASSPALVKSALPASAPAVAGRSATVVPPTSGTIPAPARLPAPALAPALAATLAPAMALRPPTVRPVSRLPQRVAIERSEAGVALHSVAALAEDVGRGEPELPAQEFIAVETEGGEGTLVGVATAGGGQSAVTTTRVGSITLASVAGGSGGVGPDSGGAAIRERGSPYLMPADRYRDAILASHEWLYGEGQGFSIQLMILTQDEGVEVLEHRLGEMVERIGPAEIRLFRLVDNRLLVYLNEFAHSDEAEKVIRELPEEWRQSRPMIRSLPWIRSSIGRLARVGSS
ncbi:MAG: AAA family ATPase [Magnetococcales bacterium]|nr:AAA family ATPase [Magnetococcales bacterium]MBF0156004.1 AAA family ATPase [Magnetococcales bacterium]